jgi:Cu2+-exporting ATPase
MVGGGYFLTRAWRGLRMGVLDLDLPIALGVTGAYLGSLAGWLFGKPELVYFDFVSLFLFLMLVGRWTQEAAIERNRHHLLRLNPLPPAVRRADNRGEKISLEALKPGDRFLIGPGQLLPVAARLLSHHATLGLAWITGEPQPRRVPGGRLAPAGAINAEQMDLAFEAQERWADSLLARLLQACTEGPQRATGLEKTLKIYLATVLALAAGGGLAWLAAGEPVTAARVALSLLVVSCPCVIGLALPLANELAVARLRRAGVFVREAHFWSRLNRVRTIVFDKTGTLTLEHPVLQQAASLTALQPAERHALFLLVENSLHPYSRGLREALLRYPEALALESDKGPVRETSGQGLSAFIDGEFWSLGRPGWIPGDQDRTPTVIADAPTVEFRRQGKLVVGFRFVECARSGAATEIARLTRAGYEIHILSGDRSENVLALADQLGLPLGNAQGNLTPDDKAVWVANHHPEQVLMLGDGANDALAFQHAAVRGTPVADRVVLSQASDFFLTGQSLDGIRHLFAINQVRRRAARAAIVFALAYNITVAAVCLTGKMNPLLAAVLMPSSSLLSLAMVSALFRIGARPTPVEQTLASGQKNALV